MQHFEAGQIDQNVCIDTHHDNNFESGANTLSKYTGNQVVQHQVRHHTKLLYSVNKLPSVAFQMSLYKACMYIMLVYMHHHLHLALDVSHTW